MASQTLPIPEEIDELERIVRSQPPQISNQQPVEDAPLQRALARIHATPRADATPPPIRSWWF